MTDHQARARELLRRGDLEQSEWEEVVASGAWTDVPSTREVIYADLATELRAALDENLALRAEVERLKLLALDQWAQKTTVTQPVAGNAFTGRQTGRNRPDIPTDAGVPSRCADESGFDSGISFPEPMKNDYFAQRGDAQGGEE